MKSQILLTDSIFGYAYAGVLAGQLFWHSFKCACNKCAPGENIGIVQTTYSGSGSSGTVGGIVATNQGGIIEKSSSCIYSVNGFMVLVVLLEAIHQACVTNAGHIAV